MTTKEEPLPLDLASKRKRKRSDYGYFLDFRLRWSDNDMFSHMNNPYYGVLIDSIINQYLIEHCNYKVNKHPQAAIIVNTYCDYFGSLQYPDIADVGMRIVRLGKTSVMYEVGIFRRGDDDVKAVGGSTHVYVDQSSTGELGRPTKEGMPKEIREGYERLMRREVPDPKL